MRLIQLFPCVFTALILSAFTVCAASASQTDLNEERAEAEVPRYKQPWGERMIYKIVEDRELFLYVQKPQDWSAEDERSAILFFHGGGWRGGSPRAFNRQGNYFKDRGLVVIQPEYRFADTKSGERPVKCIMDAQSAMRWVRSHASELGIDPDKIIAGGGSAGGHLAAYLATLEGMDDPQDDLSVSTRPNGLFLFCPVAYTGPNGGYYYKIFGDDYKAFSPQDNIDSDVPPTLYMVGTEDGHVPLRIAEDFKSRVESAGGECELVIFEGQGHGFYHAGRNGGANLYRSVMQLEAFFARHGWIQGEPMPSKIVNGKIFPMDEEIVVKP